MEEEDFGEDFPSKIYSMNDFLKEFQKLSKEENSELNKSDNENEINQYFNQEEYVPNKNLIELENILNSQKEPKFGKYKDDSFLSEISILSKENEELKFCNNILSSKYEEEISKAKQFKLNLEKELSNINGIINQSKIFMELLGKKVKTYEDFIKNKTIKKDSNINGESMKQKILIAQQENEDLKLELIDKNQIINNYQKELNSKIELFGEIDNMKSNMEKYLKTMDMLYEQIKRKDIEINALKNNIEQVKIKHKQKIDNINNNKVADNDGNLYSYSDEKLIDNLKLSKEKQIKLTKDLIEIQNRYKEEINNNNKLKKFTEETAEIIKKSIDERDLLKREYENSLNGIVKKYEEQIHLMKVLIVQQNEEFEKKLNDIKNKNEYQRENKPENSSELDRKMEKLKNDNKLLVEQHNELKEMNENLLVRMKELPELNSKFNELFENIELLKEENKRLKESIKDKRFFQGKLKEDGESEEDQKEELNNVNKKEKTNKEENNNIECENEEIEENEKFNLDELKLLENILKRGLDNLGDEKNENEDKDGDENGEENELDIKQLQLLEKLMRHIGNKDQNDKGKDEEDKEQ